MTSSLVNTKRLTILANRIERLCDQYRPVDTVNLRNDATYLRALVEYLDRPAIQRKLE